MEAVQVQGMIKALCELSQKHALTDNGIGLEPGWESTRLETITALSGKSNIPRFLERMITSC